MRETCYECGRELGGHEARYEIWGGEYVCEECSDRYYTRCEDCDELVLDEELVPVDDSAHYVCEDCAANYHTCSYCQELFSPHRIAIDTGRRTLCRFCYEDYFFSCAECGEVYHIDDAERVNDYYLCTECAENHRSPIQSYDFKPEPLFFGGGNAGYGVELEIDDGHHKEEAARAIDEVGEGHIYLKRDGSLSNAGFEIVTHPATMEYHTNHFPWSEICEMAESYGYHSHDTDTCGLHIHASRGLFGGNETEQDLTIAKIIILVDRWYEDYILRFARRRLSQMREWAGKPNAEIRPEDDNRTAVHKSKKTASSRYKAINLRNRHTVEFRFFRGTLKRDTIIASIQWVDTIVNYCKATPLKDLFSATWDEIFGNTGHRELTSYLKQRDLYLKKEAN